MRGLTYSSAGTVRGVRNYSVGKNSPLPGTVLTASTHPKRGDPTAQANTAGLLCYVWRHAAAFLVLGALFVSVDGSGGGCSGGSSRKPSDLHGSRKALILREMSSVDGANLRRDGMADADGQVKPSMRGAAGE